MKKSDMELQVEQLWHKQGTKTIWCECGRVCPDYAKFCGTCGKPIQPETLEDIHKDPKR